MKRFLLFAGWAVLGGMLLVTLQASLQEDVFTAAARLWADGWFRATLADAYFGFFWFWLWIAWRERRWSRALVWLVLVMGLGNFAMAGYLLWRLRSLAPGEGVAELLLGEHSGRAEKP